MVKTGDDNVENVVNLLRSNPKGLTITEITFRTNLSRTTSRIALANLEGANKVLVREIGMAKLYILDGDDE